MVSRANVPRKMTSSTPLTEAEEIELDWESVWERFEDRIEAFRREQKADFDALKEAILNLSISSQGRSMETTDVSSGNCKSQLELPKFSDDRNFHKSSDVDRAIADEDLMEQHSSEKYEEIDIELKIGVEDCTRVSTEIEDIEILEVESSLESKDYLRVEKSRKESVEIGEQNQGIFILPPARENAQMKELVFGEGIQRLPIARRNASLRELAVTLNAVTKLLRLSIRFPKPMVKMKLELFSLLELLREADMLGVAGSPKDAGKMFDDNSSKNIFSWNLYLKVVVKWATARRVFDEMPERGAVSWYTVISWDRAKEMHCRIVKNGGCYSNLVVGNSLIDMYGKLGLVEYSVAVFVSMEKVEVISRNAMNSGCYKSGYERFAWFGNTRSLAHDSLWARNLKGEGLLRSLIVEGKSLADVIKAE